ncbi:hypothetical protein TB2_033102 [Malus domestica]
MGKSQHSSNSKCLCKKVFSSPCPICKLAAAPNHVSVPGKREHKANMIPTTQVPAEPSHAKARSKVEKQKSKLVPQLTKTNRTVSLGYNDAFSNYINRARLRIQAMSNVGMEKIASRSTDDEYDARKEDNTKDAFSDYISRAKMRIRKTSSIGSRKIFSFKREVSIAQNPSISARKSSVLLAQFEKWWQQLMYQPHRRKGRPRKRCLRQPRFLLSRVTLTLFQKLKSKSQSRGTTYKRKRDRNLDDSDAFSNNINRARIKIRAVSNVGMENIASGSTDDGNDTKKEDMAKDTFSDYINRAKMRIRKTSSFGSRENKIQQRTIMFYNQVFHSQAALVSKLLKQIANAWKEDSR